MADVYERITMTKSVDSTLYELLTRERMCCIRGLKIIKRGTPEWDEKLENYLTRVKRDLSPQELGEFKGIMQKDSVYEECFYEMTPFRAVNSTDHRGKMRKRLIWDSKKEVACEIAVPQKQIHIFRSPERYVVTAPGFGRANYFGNSHYGGSLTDALAEFTQRGFELVLWDEVWRSEYLEDGEPTQKLVAQRITPVKAASIDDVLAFAAQSKK